MKRLRTRQNDSATTRQRFAIVVASSRCRRFVAFFSLFISALASCPLAHAQEVPPPQNVRAVDAPNDAGTGIAVLWGAAPGERDEAGAVTSTPAPKYEYVLSVAANPERPHEVARVPARGGWQADIAGKFGVGAAFSKDHAVVFDVLSVPEFAPARLEAAALGDPEAGLAVTQELGADSIKAARAILDAANITTTAALKTDLKEGDLEALRRVILDRGFTVTLEARSADRSAPISHVVVPNVRPEANWFDWSKLASLVVMLFLGGAVFAFILVARKNPNLYLRRISGLDAIEEALGRATEMGKPVLFVHGLETLQKVPTIAAINILGEIAKKVARYDTRLLCANYDSIVLTVSQETVREGFMRAGRPDAFNQDDVFLAGADQFSYVAAVDGIMLRQRPAANIYAGYFYAESLLLAETGASTGAIQIAATDAYTQLPFFVTTCDYTLMGEELYAASAYLSRDPLLLGSLRGQDVGKAAAILYMVLGAISVALGSRLLLLLVTTS
jgi:hypothetical protein